MSIITFLAKDRFNWIDNTGTISLVTLLSNQRVGWAFVAWAACLAASIILRVVSEELKQRTEAQQ